MNSVYLGMVIFSFAVNLFLMVPFINFLYQLKFQRQAQKTKDPFNFLTPIFDFFHKEKVGTPVGGGFLIVCTTVILSMLFLTLFYFFGVPVISVFKSAPRETVIVLFTLVAFALLGLFDDIKKTFHLEKGREIFYGLRLRHKIIIQLAIAFIISYWMYDWLGISFINIPFLGTLHLGFWYILFATFTILAFTNAFNITDGLDGLSSGVLLIALFTFWIISHSVLDTILSIVLSVWIGGLITFLYFNVLPARIFLGDTGALAFGATFAVIGLLLGKAFLLPIIGFVFVAEAASSLIQLVVKRYWKKKFFPVAPLHLYLQLKGWSESKVVFRFWLITIVCSIFGLWIAFLK